MKHLYVDGGLTQPRKTSRGVVLKDDNILLIERWRNNLHYFSIPGGGIEADETAIQAVKREIFEEASIQVKVGQKLYEMRDSNSNVHSIFLCTYLSGEPKLQHNSEEARSMRAKQKSDIYVPTWIAIEKINDLTFLYWAPISRELIKDFKNGWPKQLKILQADE